MNHRAQSGPLSRNSALMNSCVNKDTSWLSHYVPPQVLLRHFCPLITDVLLWLLIRFSTRLRVWIGQSWNCLFRLTFSDVGLSWCLLLYNTKTSSLSASWGTFSVRNDTGYWAYQTNLSTNKETGNNIDILQLSYSSSSA